MRTISVLCVAALSLAIGACNGKTAEPDVIRAFTLDSTADVLMPKAASFDSGESADGNGSLRVVAGAPITVRLFEVPLEGIENARLGYQARLKSADLQGTAYLEMWLHFPGKGDFFSRGLDQPLSGTSGWVTADVPFFLRKNEEPDLAKLNLVVDGRGTVWIDDIKLTRVGN